MGKYEQSAGFLEENDKIKFEEICEKILLAKLQENLDKHQREIEHGNQTTINVFVNLAKEYFLIARDCVDQIEKYEVSLFSDAESVFNMCSVDIDAYVQKTFGCLANDYPVYKVHATGGMLSYVICRCEDKKRMWGVELTHALLNRGITCQFTGVRVVASLKQDYSGLRVFIFKTGKDTYGVKLVNEIHGDTFPSMFSDLNGLDEIEFVNKVLVCVNECLDKNKNED